MASPITPAEGTAVTSLRTTAASTRSLVMISTDASGLRALATGTFGHATWSPAGDQSFWFKRGGSVWVSSVVSVSSTGRAAGTEDLVSRFMAARQQGNAALANSFLDAHGKDAFSGVTLTYGTGTLTRYYVLLSQPGEAVVRLILNSGPGQGQTAVDETLKVNRGGSRPLIDDVTESPVSLSSGPSIVKVTVSSTQVSVTFDSDLDPDTVRGVSISDAKSAVSYNPAKRTVVLTLEEGLRPGTTYQVMVGSSLKDVNGGSAASYQLTFIGPDS